MVIIFSSDDYILWIIALLFTCLMALCIGRTIQEPSKEKTLTLQSYTNNITEENIKNMETVTVSEAEKITDSSYGSKNTPSPEVKPTKEEAPIKYYTEQDAIDIAKVLYNECRGVASVTEQACVAWTVLNRVDIYNSTIYSVIRAPHQFAFYEQTPVWDELLDLAYDVLERWSREKDGETNVGRVLPPEYIYFRSKNGHNCFRDNYSGTYNIWDYSLKSPYYS